MEKFLRMIFGFKEVKFRNDDDFFDRLTRRHSVCLLLLFSLVITTKQYVGDPIYCWAPAQFTDAHKHYTNTICWVKNTYYVPWDVDLPKTTERRQMITYYQWVPMILLCQALVCYVPSLIWRYMCRRSGLNVAAVMDAAIAGQKTSYADIREKTTRYIVHQLDKYLTGRVLRGEGCFIRMKQWCARYCCFIYGKVYGNYLSLCYLVCKLLYVVNAIGQLYLLDIFLGSGYHFYGFEVLRRFATEYDWTMSERFPRVTICDFLVRHQGQQHRYVVQCVIPINLFNEKIFIFIWFWFAFLCALTIISFFKWAWNVTIWPAQKGYVLNLLTSLGAIHHTKKNNEDIEKFIQNYLKRDGIFVVRLIGNNLGGLVSMEVLGGLWDNYGPEMRLLGNENPPGGNLAARLRANAPGVRLNSLAERLEAV